MIYNIMVEYGIMIIFLAKTDFTCLEYLSLRLFLTMLNIKIEYSCCVTDIISDLCYFSQSVKINFHIYYYYYYY